MKLYVSMAIMLLLTACATITTEKSAERDLFKTYDTHCKEYAQKMSGEADEQTKYLECMSYFIHHEAECPYCVISPK